MKLFFLLAIIVTIATLPGPAAGAKATDPPAGTTPATTGKPEDATPSGSSDVTEAAATVKATDAPTTAKAVAKVEPAVQASPPPPSGNLEGQSAVGGTDSDLPGGAADDHTESSNDGTTAEAESTTQAATGLMFAVPVMVAIMGQYM